MDQTYNARIKSQALSEKALAYAEEKMAENNIVYPHYIGGLTRLEIYAKQQLFVNKQMMYIQEYMAKHNPASTHFKQDDKVTMAYNSHSNQVDYVKRTYGKPILIEG